MRPAIHSLGGAGSVAAATLPPRRRRGAGPARRRPCAPPRVRSAEPGGELSVGVRRRLEGPAKEKAAPFSAKSAAKFTPAECCSGRARTAAMRGRASPVRYRAGSSRSASTLPRSTNRILAAVIAPPDESLAFTHASVTLSQGFRSRGIRFSRSWPWTSMDGERRRRPAGLESAPQTSDRGQCRTCASRCRGATTMTRGVHAHVTSSSFSG
jgi:hypothetical protein